MQALFKIAGNIPLLRQIASASHDAVLVFDTRWRVSLCNGAASRLLGLPEHEAIGRPVWQVAPGIISYDQLAVLSEAGIAGCAGDERLAASRQSIVRAHPTWFVQPLFDEKGQAAGALCLHPGAGVSGGIERQLRESDRRFRDFVESASDWFWETDRDLCYSYVSERYQDATGLPPESRLGRRRGDFRLAGPDDGDWSAHIADLEARRPFRDFTFAYLDARGCRRVARVSGRPVFDEGGTFSGYRGVGRDITSEVDAQNRIRFLAQHDALTGLPNRTLLTERLQLALAAARRRAHGDLALLCVDLDDFKLVNDTLGHAAGDALLCEIAHRMREAVREHDTVARLGGDEFAVVQAETQGWEDAKALAERLIDRLCEPVEVGGERVHCGASIGISFFPGDGTEADELIRNADLALYKAKAAGRNTFCCYLPAMDEEVRKRRLMEDDLRDALDRNSFILHYQPQVDLLTGRLVGVEALLRLRDRDGGLLAPGSFMPVAERSGMIVRIDRWALREACSQAKAWSDAALLAERIAVNLSAVQLARPDLVADLIDTLEESGLPAHQLALEITESVLLTDTEAVAQTLAAVHALGVELVVDDFGTGYSSLTYLRRFPVQKVKIDLAFVRNVCSNPSDASIARAIISLGHSLGLQVVAEGVEAAEQLDYLRNAGCDQAQGYYIAMPMSSEACEVFLREAAQQRKQDYFGSRPHRLLTPG